MVKLGELEAFIRNILRIQLDEDIGKGQLIDLYDYVISGLDPDEEYERTAIMCTWAGIISAKYTKGWRNAEITRRNWAGQLGIELKGQGVKTTDTDVKHAIRADQHWVDLSRDEAEMEMMALMFKSFYYVLDKKLRWLGGGGERASYDRPLGKHVDEEKVAKKIKKRVKRKPA
jgi:hypothetical protein